MRHKLIQRNIKQNIGENNDSNNKHPPRTKSKRSPRLALLELTDDDQNAVEKADAEDEEAEDEPSEQESDEIKQLRQLGELKDAGILTKEEFETKKAEILARM